jgi:HlyD family secretion protein
LYVHRDVALADVEQRRSSVETSRHALEQARHRLAALSQVRDPDLRVAESELQVAEAQLAETGPRLAALTVNAPASGRAIKVHAHAGEQITGDGIVEIADTSRMSVEAEVYASDIAGVQLGQHASLELEGSGIKLEGVVTRIGQQVQRGAVLPNDPVAYSDAHVVAVRIRVPGCTERTCPIHARVRVIIGAQ